MLAWVLRLVLLYLVFRAIAYLVRGITEGLSGPRPGQPTAVPLVRDPVCGTFVVPSKALSAGSGADTRFFCSEDCRRTYAARSVR
jgi:YHS domain-containing protein